MEIIKTLKLHIDTYELQRGSTFLGKVVFYKIKVTAFPKHEWEVSRRYSEFSKLALKMKDLSSTELPFPPKSLFPVRSKKAIQARKESL